MLSCVFGGAIGVLVFFMVSLLLGLGVIGVASFLNQGYLINFPNKYLLTVALTSLLCCAFVEELKN